METKLVGIIFIPEYDSDLTFIPCWIVLEILIYSVIRGLALLGYVTLLLFYSGQGIQYGPGKLNYSLQQIWEKGSFA